MSDDDTPTERFRPRRGDDDGAPTERFDAVPSGSNESAGSTGDADEGAPTERFDAVPVETTGEADDVPTRGVPQQDSADHDTEDVDNLFGGGDAPTRRLPSPVNDAPTERFGAAPSAPTARYGAATPSWQPAPDDIPVYAAPAPVGPPRSAPPAPPKSSKGPLTALIIIGTLLVVGVVVLVLVLTSGTPAVVPSATPTPSETATPTPSETPSETPTPTPTETTPPAPEPASFVSFSPQDNTEISCPDDSSTVPLTFSWTSTGAEKAWIAAGETDARANPDAEVDPSGTYRDLTFDCSQETQIYTVSLENEEGELTSQSVTLRRALD